MPYGILKADTLTYYTASGDISIPVSGIAATVSGTIGIPSGTAAAPSISYIGDPDTGFYSPGANQVAIATSGTGRVFVNAAGNVGIGNVSPGTLLSLSSPSSISWGTTNYPYINGDSTSNFVAFGTQATERARIDASGRLLVGTSTGRGAHTFEGTDYASSSVIVAINKNTLDMPFLQFIKSRGTATGSVTAVQNNDYTGGIEFIGADGSTATAKTAGIYSQVDGTPGTNDMPGRLVFSTTADGASIPTERMRISNSGVVTIKNGAVAEIGTLTDGATITPDFAANCNFTVTISGNRTIANPTNITAGQAGSVFIVQGSGSNTVSWGSYWDFPSGTAPTLSTASGAVDRVDYIARTATSIHTVFTANYS